MAKKSKKPKPEPKAKKAGAKARAKATAKAEAKAEAKAAAKLKGTENFPLKMAFETTADIRVTEKLVGQVIGQEQAAEVIKKAAVQKRNVLLVGEPGTGKTLLAQAMAELLPAGELEDILVLENPDNENMPKARTVKAGEGRKLIQSERMKRMTKNDPGLMISIISIALGFVLIFWGRGYFGDILTAALLIGMFLLSAVLLFALQLSRVRMIGGTYDSMKLLVDNSGKETAPFVDATGSKAGALLGDCRHDPLQSGGLGTPAHLRVEAGAVQRAHKGVLYVDEVSGLRPNDQQELLTAMQEKKLSITGRSELSSGALTKTEPVPCDFLLIAAGNYRDLTRMHPALRSRIRGYGYEVYMNDSMDDTPANRAKIAQFVAQEVKKDGRIPHFSKEAVEVIVSEARKRCGRKHKLTLKLRDLGGLIRAAGDIAIGERASVVSRKHVLGALGLARTLEQQAAQQIIDIKKDYKVFLTRGSSVGRVNGLALLGDSGIVQPIAAEVAPAASKQEGKIIATGKLGTIAKEAVENVSAIIKKYIGKDISSYDIHIQFLQSYEGLEGDSASISVATAVVSALEGVAIEQNLAMTGSLSVRGEVLPVGGVTQKIEAAIEAGMKAAVVPKSNVDDVVLDADQKKKITIIPARNLYEVLEASLKKGRQKELLLAKLKSRVKTTKAE
jgi:Lon-like ATP-dependent protease